MSDKFCSHCMNYGKAGGCIICGVDLKKDPEMHSQYRQPIPVEHKPRVNNDDPWEGIDIDLWRRDRGEYIRRVQEAKKIESRRHA